MLCFNKNGRFFFNFFNLTTYIYHHFVFSQKSLGYQKMVENI